MGNDEFLRDLRRHSRTFFRYAFYLSAIAIVLNLLSGGASFARLHVPWWGVIALYFLTAALSALIWSLFDQTKATIKRYTFQTFLVLLLPGYLISLTLYPELRLAHRFLVVLVVSIGLGMFYGRMIWKLRLIARGSSADSE